MTEPAVERESLKDEMRNVVEEARMVIPGIQALFGFQTMAVFNERFADLPPSAVTGYLVGLCLLALSIGLLMAPAAYHRIAERGQVSRRMIDLSSRFITAGLVPLMLGVALDIYVVCIAAVDDARLGAIGAIAAACVFTLLWFVFPIGRRRSFEGSARRRTPTPGSGRA
jgi:hypothetical protein